MIENEFTKAARKNELTFEKVKDFFELTPQEEIERSLCDLALYADNYMQNWHGLQDDFSQLLRELNSPQAMALYVKHYIGTCYSQDGRIKPKLSAGELQWMIEKSGTNQCLSEALDFYISTVRMPVDQQMLIYQSERCSLFETMVQHQRIASEVQNRLINDFNDSKLENTRTKLEIYITHNHCGGFYEKEEKLFMKSQAPWALKIRYCERHGLNNHLRDSMILAIWTKFCN